MQTVLLYLQPSSISVQSELKECQFLSVNISETKKDRCRTFYINGEEKIMGKATADMPVSGSYATHQCGIT